MATLAELGQGALVRGILPGEPVTIINATWHGTTAVEITYRDATGRTSSRILFRADEPSLQIVTAGLPWSFDADGALFRLVSEAKRISLGYLFDPLQAVHTSMIEPLPHQITAVYEEMLPRQPLRFLLADDPGSGKTIMAGLFIKELYIRGDVRRCLICCPGNLDEQWQDEMYDRFGLHFEIVGRQAIEQSLSGNPFQEKNLVIARLDQMSRNEDVQAKISETDWDLIICDEAHKMSASFYGREVKETKRYRLGKLLGSHTRHFLLLTATPHNGKEEDFQLFMALLDGDRFEGRMRDSAHISDSSDLMRRLSKEELVKFDGTPLFPERMAYTIGYELSDLEAMLYTEVTNYVREEMNRADRFIAENEGRRVTVGFALTVLQRRLASSPEAIYQSIRRRHERLKRRLEEERLLKKGAEVAVEWDQAITTIDPDDLTDLDEVPSDELEELEEEVVDLATAARTIQELEAEVDTLGRLEELADRVRHAGTDRKWEELSRLLQDNELMFTQGHARHKLIIFTEHRDTLNYLVSHIRSLLGREEAVATIHGGVKREERRKIQEAFNQDKELLILVATDAAGEGINLHHRAHLMINYDLPWNPNRIEQRFGRIHRIGQNEVCHLWNLIASETREGDVYYRLLQKIEQERESLGGQVFDILGKLFQEESLRDLLIQAIRYGDSEEVRAKLYAQVDKETDRGHLQALIDEKALAHDCLDRTTVLEIKRDMERAAVRRLQPHFIASFFLEAFRQMGGTIRGRESRRYEITHVPAFIRHRDRQIGVGDVVLPRYERVTFYKEEMMVEGRPSAELICPGHPLIDAVIDLVLERYRGLLKQGAMLIDPNDAGEELRVLFYLEHTVQDARTDTYGNHRVASRRLQFVEIRADGGVQDAGAAPYINYRPISVEELELVQDELSADWLKGDLEAKVIDYAVEHLVLEHYQEVMRGRIERVDRTMAAVKDRLTKEIYYWGHRAEELKAQELAGKTNAKINSGKARQRADELTARLERRMRELEEERQLSPLAPLVVGGALVLPVGLIEGKRHPAGPEPSTFARDKRNELIAMQAVAERERALGRQPVDVSERNLGYDIESYSPVENTLYFIEVKGRISGAPTVTITANEIRTALNLPERYVLAIVEVEDGVPEEPVYIRQPFQSEPDFGVTSVNYNIEKLKKQGGEQS